MKYLIAAILLLISPTLRAQGDASVKMLIMVANDSVAVYDSPNVRSEVGLAIPPDAAFCAATFYQGDVDQYSFWKIVYRGHVGYVIDNNLLKYDVLPAAQLRTMGIHDDSVRLSFALTVDKRTTEELANLKLRRKKNGFAITQWSWSYESEYSIAATVDFTIGNFSKKRIKYATVYVSARNAVNDRLSSRGAFSVPLKGIGPIEPGEEGSYSFDYAFWSRVIETMQIDKVTVLFFDGSTKTVTTPRDYIE